MLPRYLISKELKQKRLVPLLRKVKPQEDHFRLYFRTDDPRRSLYESLAKVMREEPLR